MNSGAKLQKKQIHSQKKSDNHLILTKQGVNVKLLYFFNPVKRENTIFGKRIGGL